MMDGLYADERVSNDALPDQKSNAGPAPVNTFAQPEQASPSANDAAFQPSPASVVGDLNVSPRAGYAEQLTEVHSSGDLASGGFSGGADRKPHIRGL